MTNKQNKDIEEVDEKDDEKILRFCSRCGKEWCKLGKILEYGKYYPPLKVKNNSGEIKEMPSDREIKKAVCRECAKDIFDNEELKAHGQKIYEQGREDEKLEMIKMLNRKIETQKKFMPSTYETGYAHALEDILQACNR